MKWIYETGVGVFSIVPKDDGRFYVYFDENELLGSSHTVETAARWLADGEFEWPRGSIRPEKLAIPEDMREWKVVM